MKFIINGMYLTENAAGIANVIINVAKAIAKENKVLIISHKKVLEENKYRLGNKNIEYIVKRMPFFNKTILWFFFIFPRIVNKTTAEYLWNPAVWTPFGINKKIKKIVSVNDFVSRDYKKTMRFFNRIISNFIEKHSIKEADYLWCISEYTRKQLETYYPRRKQKNIFVGCAPDPFITKLYDSEFFVRTKNDLYLPSEYMLFVGSLEPRKNLKFLLSVFKEFVKENSSLNLVIVGAKGWGKTEISAIVNAEDFPKDRVLFTGFVSEEQLRVIYNLATLYISTSLNEGFGLPQVEAMNCEVPVISPHNSAMIEVVSGAGVTVDSWNIQEWIKAINYTLEKRESIIELQNKRRKQYSWDSIVPRFYEYIEQ